MGDLLEVCLIVFIALWLSGYIEIKQIPDNENKICVSIKEQ